MDLHLGPGGSGGPGGPWHSKGSVARSQILAAIQESLQTIDNQ